MVDSDIVERCRQGDEDAFGSLYEATSKKAYWTAYLLSGRKELAEDIVQESYFECFQAIGKLQRPELFGVWFHRLLVRTSWRLISKTKKNAADSLDEEALQMLQSDEDVAKTVMERHSGQAIRQAIRELKPKMRTAIVLFYYNNMTIQEIAHVMGCLQGTVKSRLFYAKQELGKILGRELDISDKVSEPVWERGALMND